MSSIIYAGVGGTFSDFLGGIGWGNNNGYIAENGPDTFVKNLAIEWPYGPGKLYYRGPGVDGVGTNTTIVHRLVSEVMELRGKMSDCKGVVLCGHSRGGAAVVVAARRLMMRGVDVDALILLDPVNCTPWPESHAIPSNVKHVIKAMRNPFTKSRPLWGNCGTIWNPFTTSCDWDHFYGTHAAMGGQEWKADSLVGGYIYELPEIGPTMVTLSDDVAARADVWNFFYPRMRKICDALIASGQGAGPRHSGKPVTGQPVGGGIPVLNGQKHTVVSGESLSLISGKYWKDVLLWPILYNANKAVVGSDPNKIFPGQKLTVPSIAAYSQQQLSQARTQGRNWH
ncbi:MAG: LysM peptidoglycan-binding domain-containing protein [Acidobacteria bacterium]|nr:LysM peptidoglycan-binding domain-containing protein [Acidobacteriota bacterium]